MAADFRSDTVTRPTAAMRAAMLDADRLLVAGGFDGSSHLDSTEVLELAAMSFTPGPST